LCYALARNYKGNLAKGKKLEKPIAFQGGVAANKGVIKAFEDILELKPGELIIPEHFASMGALGTIYYVIDKNITSNFNGLEYLENYLTTITNIGYRLEQLGFKGAPKERHFISFGKGDKGGDSASFSREKKRLPIYLGIDVGSISTNVVAIDENNNVIAKRYLMTSGRPIEAVQRGVKEIGDEIGEFVTVAGAGTTGSGRYLTGDFLGADIVRNEITAQATAAAVIDKGVDTIFEIGGQDSKYISLENGVVVDFNMNQVCAAGTGSFLEEQAEKLGINIKQEFGNRALECKSPVGLGERCTVFMESDLVHLQQKGASVDELVSGLSYSIVHNYLNRVVCGRRVGNKIFFQGGVAANKGVIAAFEKITGKPIIVPEHHEVTGAIGIAILSKKHMKKANKAQSRFRGFKEVTERKYTINSLICDHCSNNCQIRKVSIEGEKPLYYGNRCSRWDFNKDEKGSSALPDLFKEREKLLLTTYIPDKSKIIKSALTIGIPKALFIYEWYPFWQAFFSELGFKVVLTQNTNKQIIHEGVEGTIAESCFPIKIAHGHFIKLNDMNTDYIFLPSIINTPKDTVKNTHSFLCPYVQTIPYLIKSALKTKAEVLSPVLHFRWGMKNLSKELYDQIGKKFKKTKKETDKALQVAEEAQRNFKNALQERGREIINNLNPSTKAIVIISRSYNGCDPGLNLDIPKTLLERNAVAIPMDFLPLDSINKIDWDNMFWKYGQRILAAAGIIRKNPNLNALYITNFGCGPDSFISTLFKKSMGNKPLLQIEIDEHSAPAGVITRCEAYLDSLTNVKNKEHKNKVPSKKLSEIEDRKLYLPFMGDHAYALAASFKTAGIDAEVMPVSDEKSVELGRKYTSGKECFPAIVTAGDMLKIINDKSIDNSKVSFFMPSGTGPCRFGQYKNLHYIILNETGNPDIPILSPNQGKSFYNDFRNLKQDPTRKIWRGLVATDILVKALHTLRPYEINKGETYNAYKNGIEAITNALISGDIFKEMKDQANIFKQIKVDKRVQKPIIGIIGEIYVRSHPFCNDYIIENLESLGAEVCLSSCIEWFYYTNFTRIRLNKKLKEYKEIIKNVIKEKIQVYDEGQLIKPFKDIVKRNLKEAKTTHTLSKSNPYLDDSFEGEAALSLGKAIEFYEQDLSGIVNVMPFSCMPGTIVSALLKEIRKDHQNIPIISLAFDGHRQANTFTRLEAFMHQVKQYMG
jgi:predicted CoA-substrate-specific enzyme activase